jgi:hypothetical protein
VAELGPSTLFEFLRAGHIFLDWIPNFEEPPASLSGNHVCLLGRLDVRVATVGRIRSGNERLNNTVEQGRKDNGLPPKT